jgi:hypothetical protein
LNLYNFCFPQDTVNPALAIKVSAQNCENVLFSALTVAFGKLVGNDVLRPVLSEMLQIFNDKEVIVSSTDHFMHLEPELLQDYFGSIPFLNPMNMAIFIGSYRDMRDLFHTAKRIRRDRSDEFNPSPVTMSLPGRSKVIAVDSTDGGNRSSRHVADTARHRTDISTEEHKIIVDLLADAYVQCNGSGDLFLRETRSLVFQEIANAMNDCEGEPLNRNMNYIRNHLYKGCSRCPRWVLDFVGVAPPTRWVPLPSHAAVPELPRDNDGHNDDDDGEG